MTLVENTATLTVLKIGKGDVGQYTCYASNVAGKDSCSAHIWVCKVLVERSRGLISTSDTIGGSVYLKDVFRTRVWELEVIQQI